ncbi:MAG TPA: hypothetical protein VKI00_06485 [Mycobacterium sp.]|uniref:hypothetical protein n=1 Tax=Mycobacterium sp. TaxID=1785 RepID=UPI002BC7C9EF|nr:hypothetical protein [Mycobacterium sp.]HME75308.1 hypothetical protein [Mycobacterium sp.]
MADRLDVTARLAEGRPAVERTQTYVRACHVLGYQDPDLTARGSQVLDWYETESGLDLRVLDDDGAELRAALNTIDEAMWLQRAQLTEIAAAWTGSGADSATRFLQRHCDIAAEVAAHVRAAAEGYGALRDKLWQLVDSKAATAAAIDDRRAGERSAWLAAAHTVTAGAGDRPAEELVRDHVIPYVDNDIRSDWLSGMRSIGTSVEAAYDAAVEALSSAREVCFEIPGELGPRWQPVSDESPDLGPAAATIPATSTPAPAAPTVPAAASAPVSAAPPTPSLSPDAVDDWPSVPADLAAPLGDAAGLSSGAGGLGSLGGLAGSIGGVVGQIVNGIGGLLGSLADGFADPSEPAEPLLDDPLDDDDPLGDDAGTADDADAGADDEPDKANNVDTANAEPPSADDATEASVENPPAASDPVDEPLAHQVTPPEAPPPPTEPRPDGSTPCEIAEDELPQAGQ